MKGIVILALAVLFAVTAFSINAQQAKGSPQTKKAKIGMAKARQIALDRASGKIEGAELEKEHGKTIYSFDIRNSKGTITEVQVEAYTGEIVSVQEENARQEAAEKKQEKNEKKPHKTN